MKNIRNILAATVLVAGISAVTAQEDYSTWAHTKAITLNTSSTGANVTAGVGGIPVLVRLTSAHSEIFLQAKTGGADIRFRKLPGAHLPYQIESWDSAGQTASIWVLLDTVLANNSTQTFNIYWGKASAVAASSGSATFPTAGGYQGVWHFNNSVGDATSNAINGVDEGSTDAAGAVGRGRDFNGSSRITLGNNPVMSSGDADRFTVEAWSKVASIGTGTDRYRCIMNHGTGNGGDQFYFYARNPSAGGDDPHYSFGYYTGSASTGALAYGIAPDIGVWAHVTGTYDGSNWTVYRNGVQAATAVKDGSPVNSGEDWVIGAFGTSRNYIGTLDEIRFSNRVRSDAWIKLSYETQKSTSAVLTYGPTTTPVALQQGISDKTVGYNWVDASASSLVFKLPAGAGTAQLTVVDMKGRAVWSREANLGATETTLSHAGLRTGSYIARLTVRENGAAERTLQQKISIAR